MEDHKNVIFKIASIRDWQAEKASHGFYFPYCFNQRKTLQFDISIFRHIFVELHSCVPFTPGCWGCGWQLAIRFIPSIGDINTQESTVYGGSPMCGMPSRLCDSWKPPKSPSSWGMKAKLVVWDCWGWNTTQLIQYRSGSSKPLPRIPSWANQC